MPRLVHEGKTLDSVNTLRAILREGQRDSHAKQEWYSSEASNQEKRATPPELCCVLLDDHDGLNELRALSRETGVHLAYVNSAEIFCDLFAEVRSMIRKGLSPSDIQGHLDQMTSRVERRLRISD